MKGKYQKIIGAFVLGILVPFLAFRIGGMARNGENGEIASEPQDTASSPTESGEMPTLGPPGHTVLVYMPEGNVVQMSMEDYLVGVILAEMSTDFEMAALQAQAVAARTYALRRQGEGRHPSGAVCTDSNCCQAYVEVAAYLDGLGYQVDVDRARQAAETTCGEVITFEGQCIEATYFSCAGGKTEDAAAVWGVSYPYLKAVESPEESDRHHKVRVELSEEELEDKLGRVLYGTPESWLGWTTYTAGGGVKTVFFGGQRYQGTEFRSLLGLPSTAFTLEPTENGICATTCGKGHRVGMSQCGAQIMALEGSTYREILLHYYQGVSLEKLDALGLT